MTRSKLRQASHEAVRWKLKVRFPQHSVLSKLSNKIDSVIARVPRLKPDFWKSRGNPYNIIDKNKVPCSVEPCDTVLNLGDYDDAFMGTGGSLIHDDEILAAVCLPMKDFVSDVQRTHSEEKFVRKPHTGDYGDLPSLTNEVALDPSLDELRSRSSRVFSQDAKDAAVSCWTASVYVLHVIRSISLRKFFSVVLPITSWLPVYTLKQFVKDVQSGLVVGCMLVPQSMGYAGVAGLPVERGLYSSFVPLLIYSLFGTSRQMGVGPVAIISLLIAQGLPACSKVCKGVDAQNLSDPYPHCPVLCPDNQVLVYNEIYGHLACTCAVMSGLLQIFLAPVLGFVMNFVPHPVIAGFTSGGGLIIAMSQLESVMGFPIRKERLQDGISDLVSRWRETNLLSCAMGFMAIAILLLVKELAMRKTTGSSMPYVIWISRVAKLPWVLLLVVIYTLFTASYDLGSQQYGVKIVGYVPPGIPSFSIPPMSSALSARLLFLTMQMVIIGYLESIAIETKFGSIFKYQIRPTQEAVALGFANLFSGLTAGYPITGSFSRSAINATYGSKTPLCNAVTSIVIMFSLLFLTNFFQNMPKNILAAIVIVAALSLLDVHEVIFLWRSSKKEWFLMIFTFVLTAFFALELGILISVSLCVAEVLFKSTRPKIATVSDNILVVYLPGSGKHWSEETTVKSLKCDVRRLEIALADYEILFCRVEGDLTFASAAHLKKIVSRRFLTNCKANGLCRFVFDLCEMDIFDTTALNALIVLVEEIEAHSVSVLILGIPPRLNNFVKIDAIRKRLANAAFFENISCLLKFLSSENSNLQAPDTRQRAARKRGRSSESVASRGSTHCDRATQTTGPDGGASLSRASKVAPAFLSRKYKGKLRLTPQR